MGFFKKLKKAIRKVYQAPFKALGLKARSSAAGGSEESTPDQQIQYAARSRVAGSGVVNYTGEEGK